MSLDINKIKAAALAATHGEWKTLDILSSQPQVISDQGKNWNNPTICNFYDDVTPEDSVTCGNWYEPCTNYEANSTYIATANPSAVLELIERLKAAEEENAALLVAIEAKDAALHSIAHGLNPWAMSSVLEALAIYPSTELLEARDRKHDAENQLAKYKADAEKNSARLTFVTETDWRVTWRHKHGEPKKYRMIDDGAAWGRWHKTAEEAIDAAMVGT